MNRSIAQENIQTNDKKVILQTQKVDVAKLPLSSDARLANDLLTKETIRFGEITRVDREKGIIWVTCTGDSQNEIPARMGSPYLTLEDILMSFHRIGLAVIDFETVDKQPVIRDIYFSLNESKKTQKTELPGKKIHIAADEIILEGKQKVTIKSGDTQTEFHAENGKITQKANKIRSVAKQENKIQGGAVRIN